MTTDNSIVTAQDAREYLLRADPDAIREVLNCHEVDVDAVGDVWIADPQRGHWLGDDALIALAIRLAVGV